MRAAAERKSHPKCHLSVYHFANLFRLFIVNPEGKLLNLELLLRRNLLLGQQWLPSHILLAFRVHGESRAKMPAIYF